MSIRVMFYKIKIEHFINPVDGVLDLSKKTTVECL